MARTDGPTPSDVAGSTSRPDQIDYLLRAMLKARPPYPARSPPRNASQQDEVSAEREQLQLHASVKNRILGHVLNRRVRAFCVHRFVPLSLGSRHRPVPKRFRE